MTKRLSAKHKISRRIGQNLWGTSKSPVNKRESGPGQHGASKERDCQLLPGPAVLAILVGAEENRLADTCVVDLEINRCLCGDAPGWRVGP